MCSLRYRLIELDEYREIPREVTKQKCKIRKGKASCDADIGTVRIYNEDERDAEYSDGE